MFYLQGYKHYGTNVGRGVHPFNMPKTHPPDRSRTTPHFDEPYNEQSAELIEPCPLCGRRFSTTAQLTVHAASCS